MLCWFPEDEHILPTRHMMHEFFLSVILDSEWKTSATLKCDLCVPQ